MRSRSTRSRSRPTRSSRPKTSRGVTLLILSCFGLLFLTNCGGTVQMPVSDATGRTVGNIQIEDENNATIVSINGEVRGKVRGLLVRGENGGRTGTLEMRDGHLVLLDADKNAIGSVENGTDCYGKSQTLLGKVPAETDTGAAGAACMLLLLPKE